MKILITSGGTTESLDTVRGISNFATGSLGKIIAEKSLIAGHEVYLLAGQTAKLPEAQKNLHCIQITNSQSLFEQMKILVTQVDVVIHSMAVSDYQPIYMTGLENLPEHFSKEDLIHLEINKENKISSKSDYQVILLKKTIKIISKIKKWNPKVILVGFKLLSGVGEEYLIKLARESLVANHADLILANDLANIHDLEHEALLLSPSKMTRMHTKSEIADEILKQIEEIYHG